MTSFVKFFQTVVSFLNSFFFFAIQERKKKEIIKRDEVVEQKNNNKEKSEIQLIVLKGEELHSSFVGGGTGIVTDMSKRPNRFDKKTRKIISYRGKIFLVSLLEKADLIKTKTGYRNYGGMGGWYGGCNLYDYRATGKYLSDIYYLWATTSLEQMTNKELACIQEYERKRK